MKRAFIILICLSATLVGRGQTAILERVWVTSPTEEGLREVNTRVGKLVTKVEKRRHRNDIRKLYALFMKTHNRFLHSYVQYTGIESLAKGRYDCLTATSLFADILTKAGYQYNIIETNYHIFIIVNTTDGEVILETTDRLGGFVNDKKKVNAMISEYKKNVLASATASHYQYTFNLYQPVDPNQLTGLLFFNQAVKAFNEGQWDQCSEKLTAASQTTNSPRVAELAELLHQQHDFSNK